MIDGRVDGQSDGWQGTVLRAPIDHNFVLVSIELVGY